MLRKVLERIGDITIKFSYFITMIGFVCIYLIMFIYAPQTLKQFITIKLSVNAAFALLIILQIVFILNEMIRKKKEQRWQTMK